jgi:hypothetical protein
MQITTLLIFRHLNNRCKLWDVLRNKRLQHVIIQFTNQMVVIRMWFSRELRV